MPVTIKARATDARTKPFLDIPHGGALIRMYRIGHGDCFLIGLAGRNPARPSFMLIDCGYKPGSTQMIDEADPPTVAEIVADIAAVTGRRLDVLVLTHEHQDHLNGITARNFAGFAIGELWLAWTEDPDDPLANALRRAFDDRLAALVGAQAALAARLAGPQMPGMERQAEADSTHDRRIRDMLALEIGGEQDAGNGALGFGAAAALGANKASIKLMRDLCKASGGTIRYIRPHEAVLAVPGAASARAFALGPPWDEKQIQDLDPEGDEVFKLGGGVLGLFRAGAEGPLPDGGSSLFDAAYRIPFPSGLAGDAFYDRHYGPNADGDVDTLRWEVRDGAAFRRIDTDWLHSASGIALDMNSYTNNTSLVLAIELSPGGKVLLFAADAQRGNWMSWSAKSFDDGGKAVSARDLLGRSVVYKGGHHLSHNGTLNGGAEADHACIGWMGRGPHAAEFTALITAVPAWARTQKGWNHPYPPIKRALLAKAAGRVLQTASDLDAAGKPLSVPFDPAVFGGRCRKERLHFDLRVDP